MQGQTDGKSGEGAEGTTPRGRPARARGLLHITTLVLLVVGVTVTAGLSLASWWVHDSNEDRLLKQRTREAAAVLTASLPTIQTPLASAAAVAEGTDGNAVSFDHLMQPFVTSGQPFVSASLWRVDGDQFALERVVGAEPSLRSRSPETQRAFLTRSVETPELGVIGLFDDEPRLGYSYTTTSGPARFVAYAESALPEDRRTVVPRGSAFSGLDNAVYLGRRESPDSLITASTRDLPLTGRRARESVAFGDMALTLVMSPTTTLGGRLLSMLPWLIATLGLLATCGAAFLTERLLRRRDHAEQLAEENIELLAQQRSVAQTLQASLLPRRLPKVPGLELAVRYEAGAAGIDIGGDWYDVIPLDADHLMIVVGDVSGRGLDAATMMASLRYAIRAFASEGDQPATILTKLNKVADFERDGHFATVLCMTVDVGARQVTIANAGHPGPLIVDGTAEAVQTEVGVPVGVLTETPYATVTVTVPAHATFLAFTDGLFERRGETIDAGIDRLRRTVAGATGSVEELLARTVASQASDGATDDTAILGLRWTS